MATKPPTISNKRVAAHAALEVLEKFWADGSGVVSFPVDPVKIAERIGANVLTAELDNDVAGLLVRQTDDGPLRILLNKKDHLNRQRFTCAHELGHVVRRMDSTAPMGFVEYRNELASRGTDREEIFANQFAAELLMPGTAVRKWWSEGFSVARMAKIFDVSEDALNVRLGALGLSDA